MYLYDSVVLIQSRTRGAANYMQPLGRTVQPENSSILQIQKPTCPRIRCVELRDSSCHLSK
jgi:hypothetical protein